MKLNEFHLSPLVGNLRLLKTNFTGNNRRYSRTGTPSPYETNIITSLPPKQTYIFMQFQMRRFNSSRGYGPTTGGTRTGIPGTPVGSLLRYLRVKECGPCADGGRGLVGNFLPPRGIYHISRFNRMIVRNS